MKGASAITVSLALIMCAAAGSCVAAQAVPEPSTGIYTPPKPRGLPHFEWPSGSPREAVLFVRYTVSPQGRVTEVELLLDKGFYDDAFLKPTKALVKSMRFDPATLDGKPIEFTGIMPIRFTLGPAGGIGRDFRVELGKVQELFKQGNYLEADQHAEMMLRDTVKTNIEFAALNVTLARTHDALGHDDLALRYAEAATIRDLPGAQPFSLHGPLPPNKAAYYSLSTDITRSMLEMRMRLYGRNGMLMEARQAYDELAGLEAIAPDDPRSQVAAQITEKLAGTDPLAANGHIWDEKPWQHVLIRNNFSLDKVDGEISSVLLTCGSQQKKVDYIPGEQWSVPQGWRDCSVSVDGALGSSFLFVETTD